MSKNSIKNVPNTIESYLIINMCLFKFFFEHFITSLVKVHDPLRFDKPQEAMKGIDGIKSLFKFVMKTHK